MICLQQCIFQPEKRLRLGFWQLYISSIHDKSTKNALKLLYFTDIHILRTQGTRSNVCDKSIGWAKNSSHLFLSFIFELFFFLLFFITVFIILVILIFIIVVFIIVIIRTVIIEVIFTFSTIISISIR